MGKWATAKIKAANGNWEAGATEISNLTTPQLEALSDALTAAGGLAAHQSDGSLLVTRIDAAAIGGVALRAGIALHELTPQTASLEEVFMELTSDASEFHAGGSGVEAR